MNKKLYIVLVKIFILMVLSIQLLGCVSNTAIPKGYQGAVVTLWDNLDKKSSTNAHIFELISVDGRRVTTTSFSTRERSLKIGFEINTIPLSREIPANAKVLYLGGFNYLAVDFIGLFDDFYRITGKFNVNLEQGKSYVVNGELGDGYSLLWLEEEKTGMIVSNISAEGKVSPEYLTKIRINKIAQYKEKQIVLAAEENKESKTLARAVDFVNNKGCKSGTNLGVSMTQKYHLTMALFKNKMFKESLSCLKNISESADAPSETFRYLFLIYDVGLGVKENKKLANYWKERYENSKKVKATDTARD